MMLKTELDEILSFEDVIQLWHEMLFKSLDSIMFLVILKGQFTHKCCRRLLALM